MEYRICNACGKYNRCDTIASHNDIILICEDNRDCYEYIIYLQINENNLKLIKEIEAGRLNINDLSYESWKFYCFINNLEIPYTLSEDSNIGYEYNYEEN
jgi:ssDNA-binding Zn-finger/Zn-ribbon topoisomerase 1